MDRSLYLARSGECEEAISAARDLRGQLPVTAESAHAIASTFSVCGERREALDSLRVAIEKGFSPDFVREEDEFKSLIDDPEFLEFTSG